MRIRWGIAALLILIGVSSAYGWKNGRATIAIRQAGAKTEGDTLKAQVGEPLSLELYLDAQGERMSCCVVYLSFDKGVFEWIPHGSSARPFEQGDFFKGLGAVSRNEARDLSDSEIGLAYTERTGVAVGGVRPSVSGTGVLARFSLLVLRQSAEAAEIRIDLEYNRRATRYFVAGSDEEYKFRSRRGLEVQIVGFAISPPFPDLHLLPGDSTEVFLDEHVDDFKTPDEDILWSVQGSEHVTARLDEETRSVILRADEGWQGQEHVIFEALNSDSLTALDSMLVTVDVPPEIAAFELSFEEDGQLGIRLSDHATDRDTPLSDLVWTAGDGEFITADVQDDSLWVYAPDDWYGEDEVYVLVVDEYGLTDSAAVSVIVFPVNDPPVVEDIPDVVLVGRTPVTILLDDYVSDVDNRDEEIRWTYSGGDTVMVSLDEERRRATFAAPAGWTGSETISFVAFDPDSLSDSTTVHVSAVLAPPILALPDLFFFFSGEGRVSADLHGEEEFVLDRYVSDADDSPSALRWTVEGNAELTVDIDSVSHVLSMDGPADFRGQETLIFTVTDPAGHSDRDTSIVIVLYDDEPTVTEVPNVVLSVGETSAPIPLNDYVWDRDTPDSLITWSSSGNTYVSVSIDTLSKLTFFAEDTLWAGSEIITLTATDPEGHTGRDTVKVTVTAESFGPLQFTIALLRNPVLIRHVDFYVVASNPLGEGPTILVSGTPLDLAEMDPLRRIFRGGYDLESDTLLSVEVWGKDVWGNEGTGGRTFSAQFVRASTGGTVTSPDETWAVHFSGGALWSDQWVFLYRGQESGDQGAGVRKAAPQARFRISDFGFRIESPASCNPQSAIRNPQSPRVYVLDALDKVFREPVEVSILYDAVRDGDDVGVFRWDEMKAEWCYVPTYVDRAGRRAVASVSKAGMVRLQRTFHRSAETLPSRLRLLPNRPNPFNAETCMVYELPRSGPVSVKVFNLRGQLIRRVMEGHQCAGRHLVRWDGRDGEGRETGSGVYIYRVEFDGCGDAGKMVKVE